MVTITPAGSGVTPVISDLTGEEYAKFIDANIIGYDDVLNLYKALKKESLWNLLHTKEKKQVKKQKI
ncbi:hypothetical protein A2264_00150 [candidate division WWE3 bacterium RIFOXYA2_FULL_46_9]|uniref:Uncharacterized protein n=1 Tax=candidate division WWE3 bacterium RIFOXYA2_FULL_46_9 TaxID=1802636 RepID=A0A1F4W0Z9_UNCKA|nr:MAG: hypothetical protein A2264_00150 [candidate division WWE3 bacterium RIFOXYA2_FULL_46_9]